MYNTRNMLIPESLFWCIQHEMNIDCFPNINLWSVKRKRGWLKHSPERRAEISKKQSYAQKHLPQKIKDKIFKSMSKGMKEYWKKIDKEKREKHCAAMSESMKKAWAEKEEEFRAKVGVKKLTASRIKIIRDVPRINTYSGVITESQMEEINA